MVIYNKLKNKKKNTAIRNIFKIRLTEYNKYKNF